MANGAKIIKQLGAVERKIDEGERLLGGISRARTWGFIFFIIGFLMIIFSPGYISILSIIGLMMLIGSTWRINRAGNGRQAIETGLREYRVKRTELQARLVVQKMTEVKTVDN